MEARQKSPLAHWRSSSRRSGRGPARAPLSAASPLPNWRPDYTRGRYSRCPRKVKQRGRHRSRSQQCTTNATVGSCRHLNVAVPDSGRSPQCPLRRKLEDRSGSKAPFEGLLARPLAETRHRAARRSKFKVSSAKRFARRTQSEVYGFGAASELH